MKRRTKNQNYRMAVSYGCEAAYVANVIMTTQTNVAKKLEGLTVMLDLGHDVRSAQFDAFRVVIDGETHSYDIFENFDVIVNYQTPTRATT